MNKKLSVLILLGFAMPLCARAQTNAPVTADQTVETIVCIRHGEKPPDGLGQLNCRGLNRALALPDVLLKKFGMPEFIFAPNPTEKVHDKGGSYYYVRPLITIEPTAIRCGLPVNTEFGFTDLHGLENELNKSQYQNATIFVAWEHLMLDDFAKNMLKDNGDNPHKVPYWKGSDYDTIFVFTITRHNGQKKFSFTIDHEGLDVLSDNCP
ncbi:MAG TPA: hypothetical protein VMF08_00860 [Candidatus Sulfotelmatobacter sp.]|nr:hypothetical protein [Candidatus Sulfotelmatobacter sp.]